MKILEVHGNKSEECYLFKKNRLGNEVIMKRKQAVLIIVLTIISLLFISGCAPDINAHDINYEQDIITKANKILAEYNLEGGVQVAYAKYIVDGDKVYDLIVTSDQFETKSMHDKKLIFISFYDMNANDFYSYYQLDVSIVSQGNKYELLNGELWKNGEQLSTSAPSTNSGSRVLGMWNNKYDLNCHDIVIKIIGSSYQMTTTCDDGSSDTKTLNVEVVNGEQRLVEFAGNPYGDYMVIETNGYLAFYDNQGLIYKVPPK